MVIKNDFSGRDIVSIGELSIDEIDFIIKHAQKIKGNQKDYSDKMKNKLMISIFIEDSTRTRSSSEIAMLKMGGKVFSFNAESSSIKKGETLKDTIKMLSGYHPGIIVIRHKRDGAAKYAADITNVPVINAGDGKNQHPTQTLLDLYTINEIRGSISGTKIAIAGDLKYGRTVHSLALALSRYNACEIDFISPETLTMPEDILEKLRKRGMKFEEHRLGRLKNISSEFPILYMTRVQRERFPEGVEGEHEYEKISKEYILRLSMLKNTIPGFKIMHPLPKVFEIEESIDNTEYAYYYIQAENGLYIRMALLDLILGGIE